MFSMFGFALTWSVYSNATFTQVFQDQFGPGTKPALTNKVSCSKLPIETNFNNSTVKEIKVLEKYQEACNSFVTNQLMVFIEMPITSEGAQSMAQETVTLINEFKKNKLQPIIVAEPSYKGVLTGFRGIYNGIYDQFYEEFFSALKQAGIEDKDVGYWVPFPEMNVPNWKFDDVAPADYGVLVNRYSSALKKYFPQIKVSLLFDTITYAQDDLEYANGDKESFKVFLTKINKSLVNAIGIQGFPWVSPANTRRIQRFDANEFLDKDLLIESAKLLKTKDVWFNTGTFSTKYALSDAKKAIVPANTRKEILDSILNLALKVRDESDYRVFINLFAADKTQTNEQTNWSYFDSEEGKLIVRDFITKVTNKEIGISLFD
jgi:hypothetical protein